MMTPEEKAQHEKGIVLKAKFIKQAAEKENPKLVVAVVQLPNGAVEVIANTDHLAEKIDYYRNRYDESFSLVANPTIKIIAFLIV